MQTAPAAPDAPDEAATAPADLGIDVPGVPEPGIVTEDQGDGDASGDWPDVDYLPLYPVNEAGVPDPSTELYPGDDVEILA